MVRDLEILVTLIFLFISIFFIFNARGIVRAKSLNKNRNENKVVYIVKVIAYIVSIFCLAILYFLIKR